MRENPIKIDSSLVYDAAKLEAFIAQVQSEIDTEPVDAMVMLDVDGPKAVSYTHLCAAAVAEGEYEYGTVHGITWTWGGLADQADETAVQREAETNERYFNCLLYTSRCV